MAISGDDRVEDTSKTTLLDWITLLLNVKWTQLKLSLPSLVILTAILPLLSYLEFISTTRSNSQSSFSPFMQRLSDPIIFWDMLSLFCIDFGMIAGTLLIAHTPVKVQIGHYVFQVPKLALAYTFRAVSRLCVCLIIMNVIPESQISRWHMVVLTHAVGWMTSLFNQCFWLLTHIPWDQRYIVGFCLTLVGAVLEIMLGWGPTLLLLLSSFVGGFWGSLLQVCVFYETKSGLMLRITQTII
jgi:hypothetical protein